MNGGLRAVPSATLVKNVDQMDNVNPYRNGIPKDLPNRRKDSHWIGDVDEKEAEESLSLYCKPVELYNIIQQRCEQQPLFLQRCLSYKLQAAWQRRIKMTLSVTGHAMGKAKGKDLGANNGVFEHRSVFVMVTSPVTYPYPSEGQVVYRFRPAQALNVGPRHFSPSTGVSSPAAVTFILPELRKLVQNAKHGDVILFIVPGSGDSPFENGEPAETLANCSGRVIWGKLAISSLCLNWLRNNKENSHRTVLDGNGVETTSHVDLRHGVLQHEDSASGRNIKLSTLAKSSTERSLVQLQVHILGGEVGQTNPKGKPQNGIFGRTPLPYSLSHVWRPRIGRVMFHYLYYHGRLRKTEVTEEFSCPFCLNGCASFKGLRCHLNASHDLFNFEYMVSGELQVVNVSCRPDMVGPEGNIRDVDGLSDPRVKNFSYWFKQSRLRRRKFPLGSGDHLLDKEGSTNQVGNMEGPTQIAALQDSLGSSDSHQTNVMHTQGSDTVVITVADTTEQHFEGQLLEESKCNLLPNGISSTVSNGVIDGSRRKDSKYGMKTISLQEHRMRSVKHVENLAQRGTVPAQKRQRMKGLLGERAMARCRPSATFGGACASAGGAQDLDDCGMQQGLSMTNWGATDRPDIPRTHALLQKRQYFHSHTAQPMACEQLFGDRDSEDEVDTEIADLEDRRMLDDFVDVTAEEKEVMHLWNSFVRRHRVVADSHCAWACWEFSRENAQTFAANPALRRCLMLFLVKLWNHHLVDGVTIHHCLETVDTYKPKEPDEQKLQTCL